MCDCCDGTRTVNRGERRARTERIVERRRRDWLLTQDADGWTPHRAGRSRNLHPFDCGTPGCWVCTRRWGAIPQVTKQVQAATDELQHPECWPASVEAEVEELEHRVWVQGLPCNEEFRAIGRLFCETFPL